MAPHPKNPDEGAPEDNEHGADLARTFKELESEPEKVDPRSTDSSSAAALG